MGIVYIDPIGGQGEGFYAHLVEFSPGSPPERPQPQPPLGIWGPNDPRPSHPIHIPPGGGGGEPPLGIWGPNDPRPSHPIAGIPGLPGEGGGGGPGAGVGTQAIVLPMPPSDPPTPPPAGIPEGSTQMLIWFGPGTKPAQAWVAPFASTGPVAPPA